jgi:hypothetical protein
MVIVPICVTPSAPSPTDTGSFVGTIDGGVATLMLAPAVASLAAELFRPFAAL